MEGHAETHRFALQKQINKQKDKKLTALQENKQKLGNGEREERLGEGEGRMRRKLAVVAGRHGRMPVFWSLQRRVVSKQQQQDSQ